MGKNIQLNKNEEYVIRLYPGWFNIKANYIGLKRDNHMFDDGQDMFLVHDNFITLEEGIISHRNPNLKNKEEIPRIICCSRDFVENM